MARTNGTPYNVGDPVSYHINGDSYPCGEVESISKSGAVIKTTKGKTFRRNVRFVTRADGTKKRLVLDRWSNGKFLELGKGHIRRRDPHF